MAFDIIGTVGSDCAAARPAALAPWLQEDM